MKTLKFKTERETENMIIELIKAGKKFITTGRTEIIILEIENKSLKNK